MVREKESGNLHSVAEQTTRHYLCAIAALKLEAKMRVAALVACADQPSGFVKYSS